MESLEAAIVRRLMQAKKTLAVAESCSGGLMAHRITNTPGASDVFLGGVVAYANAVKAGLLGVPEDMLLREGAVSDAVAKAMAVGTRRLFGSDFSLSATGIAGPGGGTPDKPVGLVYIGAARADEIRVRRCCFSGDRESIKEQTADTALNMLLEWLA